jgi:Fe-S-cluster containining protein
MSNENEWKTGRITLSINGAKLDMEMTVPAGAVKPTRMLPIFQAMTSSFVDLGVQEVEADGNKISCKAGCGACCRQAVPLSEIEAYQIAELVENMEEPRRSRIKQKFAEGCRHFHETGWFERMERYAELTPEERQEIVLEYFYDGIACPFLEDESCSIHRDRPLACREYLVTSPAENCRRPTAETIRSVKMAVEPSKILRETARSENLRKLNFVPMIRALEWAGLYPENLPEKTGETWVMEFVKKLAAGASADQTEEGQTIDK